MKVDLSEKEVDLVGKHAMEAVLMEARSRTTETWKAIARKLLGLTQVKETTGPENGGTDAAVKETTATA